MELLERTKSLEDLTDCLRAAAEHAGCIALLAGEAGIGKTALLQQSTRNNALGLTRREAEILALLSQGLRNSAIAKRLFVSTKTVDHHVSAILAKLGAQTRAEAVAIAQKPSAS